MDKGISFFDVIDKLNEGYKFSRKAWTKKYITLSDNLNHLRVFDNGVMGLYTSENEDIKATDWYLMK